MQSKLYQVVGRGRRLVQGEDPGVATRWRRDEQVELDPILQPEVQTEASSRSRAINLEH